MDETGTLIKTSFELGSLVITNTVVTTWVIMAVDRETHV